LTIFVVILNKAFLQLHKIITKDFNNFSQRKKSPILGRASEIMFQQAMLYSLATNVFQEKSSVIFTGIVFSIAHLPIIFISRIPLPFRIIIPLLALFGGMAFLWLVLNLSFGWVYSYLLHLSFYVIYGLFTGETNQVLP
jgi:hypothetical protein